MALADSVPGVSGGTIAFILGFYDDFIGSIHNLVFGKMSQKKEALFYLVKLGIGWVIGMILAVLALSALFESHIYVVSSLFIGFVLGAIPLVAIEEKDCMRQFGKGIVFFLFGVVLVAGIAYMNGQSASSSMDLSVFEWGTVIRLFFIGMFAICAMFLPGISGSTLLLIFGAYIPVISAIREVLHLHLAYLPSLIFFGLGVIVGALSIVKLIQYCLEHFRAQTVFCILGMMTGSLYAIVMGPTTLQVQEGEAALAPLGLSTFSIAACAIGLALVLFLQFLKSKEDAECPTNI
jgi:putative membrane protein